MSQIIRRELRRIAITLLLALALSWLTDSLWPATLVLTAWLLFMLRQLLRLQRWIERYELASEPPESRGAWGETFDALYRILRREAQARVQLENLISRAESSVTALRDAVVVVDSQGRIEYWNQASERLLGLQAPHDKRQALTNLLRDPRFTSYLHKEDFRHPISLPAPHDENLMLEFTITRFAQGDWLILVRDVTRLHNLEQMRKDFVANVSHELKTPLTVLRGYLETLIDNTPAEQTRLQRALNQMDEQSKRMDALVNDLLLLARLEGTEKEENPQPVNIAEVLRRLRHDGLAMAPEKQQQIDLQVSDDAALRGHPAELQSAFGNLITNAVKYTPAHGKIQIRWWQDEQGGHLSVQDNGPGIDAQHIPRLTERFYRPDNSRVTSTGGTGLGLAIVKHVMMRHDGRLEIKSALGKGSEFVCHFPANRVVGGMSDVERRTSDA